MKKSEFITLLDAPEKLGSGQIVGLQEAVKEFPYFQSAQLLLTKAFHQTENLNFEGQLKKAAAFASDRKRLHDLIFEQTQTAPETEFFPERDVLPTQAVAEKTQVETEEEKSIWKEPLLPKTEDNSTDKSPRPIFIPDFGLVAEEQQPQASEAEPLEDQLQKQILTEAIHQSILLEVDDELPDLNQENKEDSSTEQIQTGTDHNQLNVVSFDEQSGHSFSDWLNFYKEESETSKSSSLWEITSEESKEAIASFRPNANLPVRREFYSAAKMAKLSVQENDDLVTQTLANIYADQGNLEKAIKAFKKLQLKYPEKRVYFAGRIKEIENQLNS